MERGLREFSQRNEAGLPVVDEEDEEIILVRPDVSITLGNGEPELPGTLYISTRKVVWLSAMEKTKGYAVDFRSISLHAVSRDPEAYPCPCIYIQIDTGSDEESESEGSDSERNGALDLSKISEMRLIPSDPSQLDILFGVFCRCAELNPEPAESEEEEEHNWIYSAEQMEDVAIEEEDNESNVAQNPISTIGYSNGHPELVRTVHEIQINDERFDDADEMEHEDTRGCT